MIHYGGVAVRAGLERSMVRICVQEVTQVMVNNTLKSLYWFKPLYFLLYCCFSVFFNLSFCAQYGY